jgi:hypothetical protein
MDMLLTLRRLDADQPVKKCGYFAKEKRMLECLSQNYII